MTRHPRALLPVLAAIIVAASPALAAPARAPAAPPSYTLEHALTLRGISDLTWSADGRHLAFVVNAPDTSENTTNQDIWLLDVAAGSARRLTRHPKNDFSPTFSPGGDTIAFVATRAAGDDAKPAIYMMSLAGGDPWAFGSYDEAVGEVRWSPDGRWLAYVKTDTLAKSIREWRKKKWDQVVEDERLQYPALWVVEVATGRQRRLTSGPHAVWNLRWAPDSRSIAFLVSPTGKPDDGNLVDIGIVPVGRIDDPLPPLRTLGVIGSAFAWSPDGRWIAWAAGTHRDVYVEKSELWVAPAAGGRAVDLTAGFDEDAETPAWSPGSDTLYFHAARGVSTVLAAVARAGGGVTLGVDRRADAGTPVIARDGRMAWVQGDPLAPAEVRVAERAGAAGRAMSAVNAEVAKLALGSTRTVRWTSTDHERIEGLLVRPHGARDGAPLKTLVLLHGGPYTDRYALGFQSMAQYFAAHGYQVFMPNFRSSGGYGTAFMVRKRSDWGGQDWSDVMTGVDSLIAAKLADPNRLGVLGHSYGGYLSAWAITHTDRFKAACVSAGAVDLAAHYGQSDIHKYRAYEFEGPPWETPEHWRRSSPMSAITRVKTPTLILVGESDQRVPMPQSQELYTALTTLHVPCEFVHYPREPHGIREPRHRADWFERMRGWFDRWIR
ncbi:MAG TPA: S9 family peptidase [Candidatus Eisenbacteria bacterium]